MALRTSSEKEKSDEQHLLPYKDDYGKDEVHTVFAQRKHPSLAVYLLIVLPWLALIVLSGWVGDQYRNRHRASSIFPNLLYSPANDAIRYEKRLFHAGEGDDITQYQGYPSPELDRRWLDLYRCTFITQIIPREMAQKLENKTTIYPYDPQRRYTIQLDVFHQLHCLNLIRKAVSPDYYKPQDPGPDGEDKLLGFHHISHCIDLIRQSLTCHSDVTPLVFQWNEAEQMREPITKIYHTCRDFGAIQEWAKERAVHPNLTYYKEKRIWNDPLDPSTWVGNYHGEK
ncbi:hypothetical protein EJ08DRAFT_630275 [Tothia fuscella]|uniref:Uncharacterized protein n=1 Tax=Tothia fuscella TaxID=1048955 RepID=A0A9P4NUJ4_9PEZI|nr:hypothetical protein EJ08DRAFT_630275 [Tothia fuscella]